jgi:hypothetical protein
MRLDLKAVMSGGSDRVGEGKRTVNPVIISLITPLTGRFSLQHAVPPSSVLLVFQTVCLNPDTLLAEYGHHDDGRTE